MGPVRWMLAASVVVAGAAGCAGYVGRGERLYREGRYLEAAEVLAEHEHDAQGASPRRQASYAVYRGLSLMALGDLGGAHQWLGHAYGIERSYPGSLRDGVRAELDQAWRRLFDPATRLGAAAFPLPPVLLVPPPAATPGPPAPPPAAPPPGSI